MIISEEIMRINRELREYEDARQVAAKREDWKDVERLKKCINWNKERLKNNT